MATDPNLGLELAVNWSNRSPRLPVICVLVDPVSCGLCDMSSRLFGLVQAGEEGNSSGVTSRQGGRPSLAVLIGSVGP